MLAMPERGLSVSIEKHNSDLNHFCDWLECCAVFGDEDFSKSDVCDLLIENEIYRDQEFASAFVDSAWAVVRQRIARLDSPCGIEVSANRIARTGRWQDAPGYAFCLLVTCFTYLYPRHLSACQRNISEQGSLFEKLTVESLAHMLPHWKISRIGWSPDNPVKLSQCIDEIIADLNEKPGGDKGLHVTSYSNEIGLDVLAHYKFDDRDSSSSVIMLQCASGGDWASKRHTPEIDLWQQIISFNARPQKGFAIPYSFAEINDFRRQSANVKGLFLDRYRLLSPRKNVPLSAELAGAMIGWCGQYVDAIPHSENVF